MKCIDKQITGIILITLALLTACTAKQQKPLQIPTKKQIQQPEPVPPSPLAETITITAVGDIMLGTAFPSEEYLPEDDGISLLDSVTPWLKKGQIVFGNLEGAVSDSGELMKSCSDPDKCYAFRMPSRYGNLLKKAGFNLLSIANNHINDFGEEGRVNTIETLRKNGIFFAGVESHPFTLFKSGKLRVGFCAFSPNNGIPDIRDIEAACKTVTEVSKSADIVIVSFHGGAEGAENRHVTRKEEFFYGENRGNVYDFAHRVIDAGADVVLGHGPHVTRAIEVYKGRFIAYSMGNFCTYARFNLRGPNGVAPLFKIKINPKGRFISGKIIPVYQAFKKGPALDPERRAVMEVRELTQSDFPETPLTITEEGLILPR